MSAKLPYKQVKIKLLDFDHDPKYKEYKGFFGISHEGKNGDEVWVNRAKLKLPSDTIELTKIHELVHMRRDFIKDNYPDSKMEEDAVELEAVARCKNKYLNQVQKLMKSFLIYEYKNNKRIRLYPNKTDDLDKIHKKIKQILLHKYSK